MFLVFLRILSKALPGGPLMIVRVSGGDALKNQTPTARKMEPNRIKMIAANTRGSPNVSENEVRRDEIGFLLMAPAIILPRTRTSDNANFGSRKSPPP